MWNRELPDYTLLIYSLPISSDFVCLRLIHSSHQKQTIEEKLSCSVKLICLNTGSITILVSYMHTFVCLICMHICGFLFCFVFTWQPEYRSDQPLHLALCSWLNYRDPICWMQIRSIVNAPNSTQLLFL